LFAWWLPVLLLVTCFVGNPPCRAGAFLTQAPLSQGEFAFNTQLPSQPALEAVLLASPADHQVDIDGNKQMQQDRQQQVQHQPGNVAVVPPLPAQQQPQQKQGTLAVTIGTAFVQQPQLAKPEESHSLQGSVGPQASLGGDSVDSRGVSRRTSGTWLLGPLGALTQAFRRNAAQVGWCGAWFG
jgi:hypothetical protein